MKNFKSFIQLDEVERVKYKDGIANKMAYASDEVKTKGNRLDNKQAFGEGDAYDKDVKASPKPHDKEAAAQRAKLAALAARKKMKAEEKHPEDVPTPANKLEPEGTKKWLATKKFKKEIKESKFKNDIQRMSVNFDSDKIRISIISPRWGGFNREWSKREEFQKFMDNLFEKYGYRKDSFDIRFV